MGCCGSTEDVSSSSNVSMTTTNSNSLKNNETTSSSSYSKPVETESQAWTRRASVHVENELPPAPPVPHCFIWGGNSYGQIGNNSSSKTTGKDRPVKVKLFDSKLNKPVDVSVGDGHVCVITEKGHLFGWGKNNRGQIGNGTTTTAPTARPVRCRSLHSANVQIAAVSCGGDSTLCLTKDGKVYGFGDNSMGELGLGHREVVKIPTKLDVAGIVKVEAGAQHSSMITYDKKLYLCGSNASHQLGLSDTSIVASKLRLWDKEDVADVVCGLDCTAVVTVSNKSYFAGHIGGTVVPMTLFSEPLKLKNKNVTQVALGQKHALVLTKKGDVYVWGAGWAAMCENKPKTPTSTLPGNAVTCRNDPEKIDIGENSETIVAVSAGKNHSAVLTNQGLVYCWGEHRKGQLGIGMSTPGIIRPCKVRPPKSSETIPFFYKIVSGGNNVIALSDSSRDVDLNQIIDVSSKTSDEGDNDDKKKKTPNFDIENFEDVMAAAPIGDVELAKESLLVAEHLRGLTLNKKDEIATVGNASKTVKTGDDKNDVTTIELGIASNMTSNATNLGGVAPPLPDEPPPPSETKSPALDLGDVDSVLDSFMDGPPPPPADDDA